MGTTGTSTTPQLTGPQIDALRTIRETGKTTRVHPAREQALIGRGYITRGAAQYAAELTTAGYQALFDAEDANTLTGGASA